MAVMVVKAPAGVVQVHAIIFVKVVAADVQEHV